MEKKFAAFIMAAVLTASAFGCVGVSKGEDNSSETPKITTEKESFTEDKKEDASSSEAVEENADESVSSLTPRVLINTVYFDAGSDYNEYFYGSYDMAAIEGDGYPELKKAVDEWFLDYEKKYNDSASQYAKDGKEYAGDPNYDMGQLFLREIVAATRSDQAVTSLAITEESFTGGVHGNSYMYGVTFDSKTGEEITFDKLGDIKEDVKDAVVKYVSDKRKEGYSFDFFEDNLDTITDNPAWYLNGMGLCMVFNPYEIASYAEGRSIVVIPYEDMPDFNKDYIVGDSAMYSELQTDVEYEVDVNGDGNREKIKLSGIYDDNYEQDLKLNVDSDTVDAGHCSSLKNAYFIKAENGRCFVALSYDAMSDDYVTELFEVTSGKPVKADEIGFGSISSISADVIGVRCLLYVLGTYGADMDYKFADGKFVPQADRFTFETGGNADGRMIPVTKAEVPVKLEKDGVLTDDKLPKGTKVYPLNTDGKSVVGFQLEDGTYGEIEFTKKEGLLYINGVSDFDIFDNLPYVG